MRHKRIIIFLSFVLLCVFIVTIYLLFAPEKATSPAELPNTTQEEEARKEASEEQPPEVINVQPIIDDWGSKKSGQYSIVVYDIANEEFIGTYKPDEVYFAASIYKLYVAYEGYLAVQRGEYELNQDYLFGQTFEECLDLMLRESDSPCAEKLWNELGKEATTEKLKSYGITNTSMTAITTSAGDAATLLIRLAQNEELEDTYKRRMFTSMKNQIYRDALAESFSEATFYDKVGFRELNEYHDVGILELPNQRRYVISLFTSGVGTQAIQELGNSLNAALNTPEE